MKLNKRTTCRGFDVIEFKDCYDNPCSLQRSSLATERAIWLGIDDAAPRVMASVAPSLGIQTEAVNGWVSFPIPEAVSITTRMHLTQDNLRSLLPALQHFAEFGELP